MNTKNHHDAIVIGGGIAGASVAAFLANDGLNVALLEKESSLAYHTTGRSAALYTPFYGPDSMRAFGALSRPFLESPAFDREVSVLNPRQTMTLVDQSIAMTIDRPPKSSWLNETECLEKVSFLRAGKYVGGVLDTQVAAIDVHALHSLYIRTLTSCGGKVFTDSVVTRITCSASNTWTIIAGEHSYTSSIVVNATGAWGDEIAKLAGISPVGLIPKRRTIVVIDDEPFEDLRFDDLPFVIVEPDYLYFQQFGSGQLMMSPIDETPSAPRDAQPEEIDKAITVARFEAVSTLKIRRIAHAWAGLRTFSQDGDPVIGWEPEHPGFFWLVGQGGYGIFTSPAIGQYATSLITRTEPPQTFPTSNFPFARLSPDRFRLT